MEDEDRCRIADHGTLQIEKFIRRGDMEMATTTFELTADGLIAFADAKQMSRLRQLAAALDIRDPGWAGEPLEDLQAVEPSRFGLH
ncbi:hypothetical protein BKE38_00370 [Pseudoroseomonas deserti]|uniref:Uncharacterized protein n=1 Tax=Teichococcus deserti TaxID=1817963 RepID=A0A1V2H8S9_9PROT|nr:hypothetical protein [Pseudoroseomonas deserti]ONG59162.1 hypothetical protein BKE38_00370 [Pseudoroseomonas deserti]